MALAGLVVRPVVSIFGAGAGSFNAWCAMKLGVASGFRPVVSGFRPVELGVEQKIHICMCVFLGV
jgi:hypothetical protein